MPLTPSQQQAVECTGKPLFIQAGAGTGKTFTLTKRVAHQLATGAVPGVEHLLTITFTNKAAAELLGRVRAELRAQGLDEEALKVDAAWICTIHSMCERILKAHAFEVGVDPGSQLLDEMASDELLAQALDTVLQQRAGSQEVLLLQQTLGGVDKLSKQVTAAVKLFSTVEAGAASFDVGPAPRTSGEQLLQAALQVWGDAQKELLACKFAEANQTAAGLCAKVDERVQLFTDALVGGQAIDATDPLQVCEVFTQGGGFKCGATKAQPGRGILEAACMRVDELAGQAAAALGFALCRALLSVAGEAYALHRELKRAQGALDIGDILVETHHLLCQHPHIAQRYQRAFASVMVDEFQDTDRLQVAIVRQLCGPKLRTLATVGDAQQSIYGFRGADLQVYREMRATMREHGAHEVALATNFRSHPGILQFVEAVFSTPQFFGGEFLNVQPGPANARELPWAAASAPRVHVHLVVGTPGPSGKAPLTAQLVAAEAEAIAQRFVQLHEQGADYGQMAVLLRRMANAGVYLQALRAHGVPCIASGGSLFYTSAEVKAAVHLLRFLENPDDDEACLGLLGSAMFDLCDDDLLLLAHARGEQLRLRPRSLRKRPSLYDALAHVAAQREEVGTSAQGDVLVLAHQVLQQALQQAPTTPYATVLLRAVKASGWWATLQAGGMQGAAVAGNIQRFCDLVADYEQRFGHAIVQVAEHFATTVQLAEAGVLPGGTPGTLVAPGNSAVQVMTFHAAKGLEFPIVAVAEYERDARPEKGLKALSEDGRNYLAYTPAKKDAGGRQLVELAEDCGSFARAAHASAFTTHASHLAVRNEAEEAQRLLYVALTRAREYVLVLGHDKNFGKKGALAKGQFQALMAAAFPEGLPSAGSVARTRTGALVAFERTWVQREEDGGGEAAAGAAASGAEAGTSGAAAGGSVAAAAASGAAVVAAGAASNAAASAEMATGVAAADGDAAGDVAGGAAAGGDAATAGGAEAAGAVAGGEAGAAASGEATGGAATGGDAAAEGAQLPRVHVLPAPQQAADVRACIGAEGARLHSYSSISKCDEEAPLPTVGVMVQLHEREEGEQAPATAFGSAFHLVAQWLLGHPNPADEALQQRLEAAARTWGLAEDALPRLAQAVDAWRSSRLFHQVLGYPQRFAEHAFCVQVGTVPLEGFIDLLCVKPARREALVVDYKTGVSGTGAEELRQRYELQASCYAYAVLATDTCASVRLEFVRPEDGMEQIGYAFTAADLPTLQQRILSASPQ